MSTDRGAGRLGEIALVDRASRIGQTGRVYWDTLLDENAASHMAFGDGFAHTRLDGQPRVNRSAVHLDVMIGSEEVEVTGLGDRKSTRLNSSHLGISYAVFCLKKKK